MAPVGGGRDRAGAVGFAGGIAVAAIADGGGGDRPRSLRGRRRTEPCFRSDQLCFTAAIGCEARGPAAADFVHSSINLALIA